MKVAGVAKCARLENRTANKALRFLLIIVRENPFCPRLSESPAMYSVLNEGQQIRPSALDARARLGQRERI